MTLIQGNLPMMTIERRVAAISTIIFFQTLTVRGIIRLFTLIPRLYAR